MRVMRVKVVAPEKLLGVNTFPTNNPDVDFTIYNCLKIFVWIWPVAISKNTLCWFRTISQNQNNCPWYKTHAVFSRQLCSLPLSPIRNISFSLSVFSAKLPSMFHLYWFHIKSAWCSIMIIIVWLTINVWGCTCCFIYTFDTILVILWNCWTIGTIMSLTLAWNPYLGWLIITNL